MKLVKEEERSRLPKVRCALHTVRVGYLVAVLHFIGYSRAWVLACRTYVGLV